MTPMPSFSNFFNALLVCIFLPTLASADDMTKLTFGVVPQQSATKLANKWSPILKRISEETGIEISFTTEPSIPLFEKKLIEGEYDLAYMNPLHYTLYSQSPGYVAIAKQADKKIRGIVVAQKDAKLSSLDDLNNASMSFPAPLAFAATVLPTAELKSQDIQIKPHYVKSHDSVYRSVAMGLYPAGGGIERTFDLVEPETKSQLKILWKTKGYTPHAIAAHPRINASQRRQIQSAFLNLNNTEEGKELLAALQFSGIDSASDADWNDVRALNYSAK
jgi:phosphonate transport system substrate-binding protein